MPWGLEEAHNDGAWTRCDQRLDSGGQVNISFKVRSIFAFKARHTEVFAASAAFELRAEARRYYK